jgi:EAL domain-containing protein (putative c-di-GMP-specific phosphodiesterase class I)
VAQIMCLDDDPRIEAVLRRLLRRLGHELLFVSSVNECKARLAESLPALLLLDLSLGRDSGIDVIHWLATARPELPLILLSGHGDSLLDTARRVSRAEGLRLLGVVRKTHLDLELYALLNGADELGAAPQPRADVSCDARSPRTSPRADGVELSAGQLQSLIRAHAVKPFLQPIVAPQDGSLQGAEVLARLELPSGRLLGAQDFIQTAEANGLILSLTEALFDRLIEYRTRLCPLRMQFLSVNLSPLCLRDTAVVELIRSLVTEFYGCCDIHAELTETAAIDQSKQIQSLAAQIKLAGATLVIDDFGTGYSSMRALAELPFETLKIDFSFVSEMFDSPKAQRLLTAIISFGQALGLELIAEGVETQAQREFLIAEDVRLAQGFLFGAPMSVDAFLERFQPQALQPSPIAHAD